MDPLDITAALQELRHQPMHSIQNQVDRRQDYSCTGYHYCYDHRICFDWVIQSHSKHEVWDVEEHIQFFIAEYASTIWAYASQLI